MVQKMYIGIKIQRKINDLIKQVAETLGFNKSEYIRELIISDLKKYGLITLEIRKSLDLPEDLTEVKPIG